MKPRLEELLAFVRLYQAVELALSAGSAQPFTADPLMNAYDFRPPRGFLAHSQPVALKALRALGYDRPDIDKGIYLSYRITDIGNYLAYYIGYTLPPNKILHLICAFKHYSDLKQGRIQKWKLLKS